MPRTPSRVTHLAGTLLVASLVTLAACAKPEPPKPAATPEVTFITVTPASVEDNLAFVGQVQAFRTVQVRSQAFGVIMARPFTEGTTVRAGDTLYRIDPIAADADARSARARLAEAEARLSNAETNAARLRPLLVGNAVAKQDVDNAESQLLQAKAGVDNAKGAVDAAEKRLSETVVRAEITGRVGKALLDVGARVGGVGDVLTTIDVVDPVYVSFRPSASQQFRWRTDPVAKKSFAPGGTARVALTMPDGSRFPREGRIAYIDPVVDAGTGTQEYRARFDNADGLLVPGQFADVTVLGLKRDSAIVVPQRAVVQQMGQQIVYTIGDGNKIAVRIVKASGWAGRNWLIEKGLAAGDRVVVDGVQKVSPGGTVKPAPLADSSAKRAPTAAAGANE